MEWMKAAVEEAKATIRKAQENMMWYYNQRRSLAPTFYPGDRVFLDTTHQDHTSISEIIALPPQTLHSRASSGTPCLLPQATTCDKETPSHV